MSLVKRKPIEIPKIRKSAKGEPCTMNLDVCNGNWETTVWAHSNYLEDGKGMGQKADDIFGAYMCKACHDEFDGRTHDSGTWPNQMKERFHLAMKKSWRRLIEKSILE